MRIGELYDPWDVFQGAYMPLVIAAQKDLSSSAKIVWSMLHYCGRDPAPSQQELAELCGLPLRTAGRCLSELQTQGFIRPKGKRDRCIVWGFIWHPSFENARLRKLPTALEASLPSWQTCEREPLPTWQTTQKTTSADMAEDAEKPKEELLEAQTALDEALMSAKLADDSLPNWQRIVRQICRLRPGYITCEFKKNSKEENLPPPPGTSVGGTVAPHGAACGGSSSSSPRGSPDLQLDALMELARESVRPDRVGDLTLRTYLKSWRAKFGYEILDSALEVAKLEQSIRDWPKYVLGTLENKRKEANERGSSNSTKPRQAISSGL
jgi:hypothetical protein